LIALGRQLGQVVFFAEDAREQMFGRNLPPSERTCVFASKKYRVPCRKAPRHKGNAGDAI
jgi:hypothetical protein